MAFYDPIHPGEILREDFLVPLGMSARGLAAALKIPPNRVTGVLNGIRSITGSTALRMARYFGTSPQFWMNLQKNYDLAVAAADEAARIELEVTPRAA